MTGEKRCLQQAEGNTVRILSPQAYDVLTSTDGAGICMRLEGLVRKFAREEWQSTGNEDATRNWLAAERRLVEVVELPQTGGQQPQEAQPRREDSEAELQRLRQQVAALSSASSKSSATASARPETSPAPEKASPKAPAKEVREDPELAKYRESMTRITCLQQELAETDKMLVERNDQYRQLERKVDETRAQMKSQAEQMEKFEAAKAAADKGRMEAERRCAEQRAQHEDLMCRFKEQEALIELLQRQLMEKDTGCAIQPFVLVTNAESNMPSQKDIAMIHHAWTNHRPVHAMA